MRITNKIMQRNNLNNININKIYQDKLSTQMSTEKKINRVSEDPVVAIRALRLRSNVTEVTQYYTKNIPDANSWLEVTESAIRCQSEVITKMIEQCTKGANGDLTSADRKIILEQLRALSDEVYSTANADYAGRYVFTGYRTDTPVSFQTATEREYTITEQLSPDDIDTVTYINSNGLTDLTAANYSEMDSDTLKGLENGVKAVDVHRIRLAYDQCSEGYAPVIKYYDENGVQQTLTADVMHSYDDPYNSVTDGSVIYVPETGEILLGNDAYNKLMAVKDDVTTSANEREIQVTYEKNSWKDGDLRPEHYFYCEADGITYNEDYLDGTKARQDIEYDVGFNQTIRVNSTADECFQHGIGRTADDILASLEEVTELEKLKGTLEDLLKNVDDGSEEQKILQTQIQAVDKALTLAKDKSQKLFEKGISTFQGYLDDVTLSITNCGNRSKKLELIENRMQDQKTTFEILKSNNEDADMAEVAIQLTSAELTYEAALMAVGKVSQNSLLNYI